MNPFRTLKNKPDRLVLGVALLFVLLICLALYQLLSSARASAAVNGEAGVWDLREYDLDSETVQIAGQVPCIPGALLTPEEFAARQDEAVLLDDAFPEQYGSSRLVLRFPDDGWYTFTRTSIDYATRLYVNGELLTEIGTVAESRDATISNVGRITFTAKAEGGVVELVQQSANFVHRSGGYHGGWLVGGAGLIREAEAADFAIVLEMGAYITLFFLHMLLFLMLPAYKPNLYFALYCFTWFIRMGTTGAGVFSILAPSLPWNVKFRMEYASVSVTILLTTLILHDVFPGMLQKWVRYFMYGSNALFLLLCLVLNTVALSWIALVFLGLCVITAGYILVRFAIKFRRPRVDQSLLLAGIGLMACVAVRDVICYALFVAQPTFRYMELSQIAVLACSLLAATAFFIATMREVSAAKDAEQRLAAENTALEQVNRLKSDLMGTLSHELRTPLAVMSGYAQLSEKQIGDGSADEATRDNLRVVSREARRLADLAGGLLQTTIAGDAPSKREHLPVATLFERAEAVGRPMLAKRGNRLVLSVPEGLPPVFVNGDMMHQVLLNLLTNANRYTNNGTVEMTAAVEEAESGFVVVTVADNGQGMDPELLPYALQPRVTDGSGSGLGLAICRQIIEGHGGRIEIDMPPTGGTRVRFTLPTEKEGGENE